MSAGVREGVSPSWNRRGAWSDWGAQHVRVLRSVRVWLDGAFSYSVCCAIRDLSLNRSVVADHIRPQIPNRGRFCHSRSAMVRQLGILNDGICEWNIQAQLEPL